VIFLSTEFLSANGFPLCAPIGTRAHYWARRFSMSKAYPHFKPSYAHEELVEHFLLTPADL
jgi:hypothetical protein